jgi:hypothetical protein
LPVIAQEALISLHPCQTGAKDMNPVSRFETPCADNTTLKIQALLADLEGRVGLLNSDIAEEEERTKVHDVSAPDYSILARNLRGRRDNLLATITILQRQLAGAEQRAA